MLVVVKPFHPPSRKRIMRGALRLNEENLKKRSEKRRGAEPAQPGKWRNAKRGELMRDASYEHIEEPGIRREKRGCPVIPGDRPPTWMN
jgi:hypothetical protein